MPGKINFFDASTIDTLEWPNTPDGEYAKRFLLPLVKKGTQHYFENIHADLFVLKIDQCVLPIVAVDENYNNSYVCSPYGHYFSHAKESIPIIQKSPLALIAKNFMIGFGEICRKGKINSAVYVNNWLFSTDLYPQEITTNQISSIVAFLKDRFPKHAIIFRSLNSVTNKPLLQSLKEHRFKFIASRQVYLTNTKNDSIFQTRILKSDLKLWRERPFEISDESQITSDNFSRLLSLYNLVYLSKHSYLNPQFNHHFLQLLFDEKLLSFKILKIDNEIKGVAGYFERNGVMLCPFFGYDKDHAEHSVIYRLLCTTLLLDAQKKGLIFHQSSGASFYKKIRRAEGCIESMAIYTRHLSSKQKLSWLALRVLINTFAPSYMKKY